MSVFDAIARGGGGADAVRQLAAIRSSRNRLLLRGLLDLPDPSGTVRRSFDVLAEVERHRPDVLCAVLDYPRVSRWLLDVVRAADRGRSAVVRPEWLAAAAAAALVRAEVSGSVELPEPARDRGTLRLPSVGTIGVPAGPVTVSVVAGSVTVTSADGARPLHTLLAPVTEIVAEQAGIRFRPRLDGWSGGRLGALTALDGATFTSDVRRRWANRLRSGWLLLAADHPTAAAEVAAIHTMVVPLPATGEGQASSTPGETFGCVAMTLPPDDRTAALTLLHEAQHAKLSALFDLRRFTVDNEKLFYAPWRPDPRPPTALLQGIYAHLGVAGFWRVRRKLDDDPDSEVEYAQWRSACHTAALDLLHSGVLSRTGSRFLNGILDVLASWETDRVPPDALARAGDRARRHRVAWQCP